MCACVPNPLADVLRAKAGIVVSNHGACGVARGMTAAPTHDSKDHRPGKTVPLAHVRLARAQGLPTALGGKLRGHLAMQMSRGARLAGLRDDRIRGELAGHAVLPRALHLLLGACLRTKFRSAASWSSPSP